jgi:endonuclease YncB( thermonuclease family)
MHQLKPLLLGALAFVALDGCSRPARPKHPVRTSQEVTQAPTSRPSIIVVEGDALVIDGRHLRLYNAYAPRTAPHAHCWAEALAARLWRQALRGLVAEARDIKVTATGGVDEYNREFARVSLDGLDLGQTLRDRGMAALPKPQAFDWCAPLSTDIVNGPSIAVLADVGG